MTRRLIAASFAAGSLLVLASSVAASQTCPTGQTRTCVQRTRMQPNPNTIYTCNTHLRRCQRSSLAKDVAVTDTYCACTSRR